MSEYQYYDFRAIDRSLTPSQMEELRHLSSRATVTNRRAEFVYQYGDFRGNDEKLVQEMFDMMLYVNNMGTRRILFRLPASLFEVSQCDDFLVSEEISHYRSGSQIILDLHFTEPEDEDGEEEVENDGPAMDGSGWLNDMLTLRDELLRGDLRVLYLAWFKAAEKALIDEEIDEASPEPEVPAGLGELSDAQKHFAKLMEIDLLDIEALAQNSPPLSAQVTFKPEEWLPMMSEPEKIDYLLRLSRGEEQLELHLNRRLKMLWQNNTQQDSTDESDATPQERRGIQELLDACQTYRYQKEKEAANKAEAAAEHKRQIAARKRATALKKLSARKEELWQEAEKLAEQGQAKGYEKAANNLHDLHDLAEQESEQEQFAKRFKALTEQYQRRRKFMDLLRDKNLIE